MNFSERLLHFHEKLVQFFEKHLKTVFVIIFIGILIGIFWGVFNYYKAKKEREAGLKLMEVVKSENVIDSLKNITEKYKGTSAALQANLILLDHYFLNKDFQSAEKILKEIENQYPKEIKGLILYGKAKLLENKKNFEKALLDYQKISQKYPDLNFLTYLDIARLAEKVGKINLAREYYQKYMNFPNMKNSGFVQYKLYELGVKK